MMAIIGRIAPNGNTIATLQPSAIGAVRIGVKVPTYIAEYSNELANPRSVLVDTSATNSALNGESIPWYNPKKHATMAR
jgi:hypothetical protein